MKIIEHRKIEECIDGTLIFEISIDETITYGLIQQIGKTGELEYHGDFPRPFFKVKMKNGDIIKGVEGNNTIRVILVNSTINYYDNLESIVNTWQICQKRGG